MIDVGRLSGRVRAMTPSFSGWLLITFVLTVTIVGAAQYVFGAWKLGGGVLDRSLGSYRGDAKVIADLYVDYPDDPWAAMAEVILHISHRPGIVDVALVDPDDEVRIAGGDLAGSAHGAGGAAAHTEGMGEDTHHTDAMGEDTHHTDAMGEDTDHTDAMGDDADHAASHGHAMGDPVFSSGEHLSDDDRELVRRVRTSGTGLAIAGGDSIHGEATYLVPLDLGGEPYVLYVATDGADLGRQIADLRVILLLGLALALVFGVPLFHVLGGRRLAREHRLHADNAIQDPLTGLGNHRAYQDTIRSQIESATRHGQPLALALLDLDGFKLVNDTSGHRKGDEVLMTVARILASGRAGDLAFRVGGDEFAVVLPQTDIEGARTACERIRDRVAAHAPEIGVSTGIAQLGTDGTEPESLWDCADAAMYQAKRSGRNHVMVSADLDEADAGLGLTQAAAFRALIDAGEMGVAFQPIFGLARNDVMGYEALARPPEVSGFTNPGELFETAERLGCVPELDALCRRAVLVAAADLPAGSTLYMNISPAALDNELLDWADLRQMALDAGLRPQQVTIELTERTRVPASVLDREVCAARAMGFRVALDDIGTGWAGFASLQSLRPDIAKVDRSIVVAAAYDDHARAVLASIATYAALTGALVIAEGVEDEATLDHLRSLGDQVCGVQGFHLGRPLPLAASGTLGGISVPVMPPIESVRSPVERR